MQDEGTRHEAAWVVVADQGPAHRLALGDSLVDAGYHVSATQPELMDRDGLVAAQAVRRLHAASGSARRPVREIAEAIITAHEMHRSIA